MNEESGLPRRSVARLLPAVSPCWRRMVHSLVHSSSGTTTGNGLSANIRCLLSLLRDSETWCALSVRKSGTWTDGAACGMYVWVMTEGCVGACSADTGFS